MKRSIGTWLAVAVAALPLAAQAQSKGTGDFSVVGAEVNTGKPVETFKVGFPGADFGYDISLSKTIDITPTFSLLWSYGGMTVYTPFGLGLSAPIRFELGKVGDGNLLFHVDPGIAIYFGPSICSGLSGLALALCQEAGSNIQVGVLNGTQFAIAFPVGVVLGFPIKDVPGLEIGGGLDVQLAAVVTSPFNFYIGPWAGPYVEYHFAKPAGLAIGLDTRFGAGINTATGYGTWFAFRVQGFVGYRLF